MIQVSSDWMTNGNLQKGYRSVRKLDRRPLFTNLESLAHDQAPANRCHGVLWKTAATSTVRHPRTPYLEWTEIFMSHLCSPKPAMAAMTDLLRDTLHAIVDRACFSRLAMAF